MKDGRVLIVVLCCAVALSVMAQDTLTPEEQPQIEASPEEMAAQKEIQQEEGNAEAMPTPEAQNISKAPRQYPIEAGVWYPGEPVPTVPSRYYRIRCWPGCHSSGEWMGPVQPYHKSPDSD